METIETKRCSKCGQFKPLSDFHKRSDGKQYLSAASKCQSYCKLCGKQYSKDLESRKWTLLGFNTTRYGGALSGAQLRSLWADTCYLCGREQKPNETELDHVVPRSQGGETTVENLRFVHKRCNRMKHDLGLDELVAWCQAVVQHQTQVSTGQRFR